MKKLITTIVILSAMALCCACQKQDIQETEVSSETESTILTESSAEMEDGAESATTVHEHMHNESEDEAENTTIIVETERETSLEVETASRPAELPTLDHAVNSDIDEGHSAGDYHGILVIEGGIMKPTYYTSIASDSWDDAQTIVNEESSAAYFRYDNYHVYADHNQLGSFFGLAYIKEGARAMLLDETGRALERYVCVRTCYGYNYGHLFDDTMTDLANLTDGTVLMYTCIENADQIYMTFWDVVDSFGEDSDWALDQKARELETAEE